MFKKNFTLLHINESYDDDDNIWNCLVRNRNLQWIKVFRNIIDVCIGMFALELPNYVLLEIIDWFPFWVNKILQLFALSSDFTRRIQYLCFIIGDCN